MSPTPAELRPSALEAARRALLYTGGNLVEARALLERESALRSEVVANLDSARGLAFLEFCHRFHRLPERDFFANALAKWSDIRLPPWRRASPRGSAHALRLMSDDERQVARYAKLCEASDHSRRWWDALSSSARAEEDAERLERGRMAEAWCVAREQSVSSRPESVRWVSLEDNTAGYDVYASRAPSEEVYIEVKYVGSGWRFFLSRHEWDTAVALGGSWRLQLWVSAESFVEVTREECTQWVPPDTTWSSWKELDVTLPPECRLVREVAYASEGSTGGA